MVKTITFLFIIVIMGATYAEKGGISQECYPDKSCDPDKFLYCDEQRHCSCNRGMVIKRYDNGTRSVSMCVSAAGLSCKINPNCVENAECIDEKCICAEGFHNGHDGYCLRGYGMSCNRYEMQCSTKIHRLSCITVKDKQICGCGNQFEKLIWTEKRGMCLRIIDSPCSEDEECLENAFCSNRKCKCRQGYADDKTKQKCTRVFGGRCSVDGDCNERLLLACRNRECACLDPRTMIHYEGEPQCRRIAETGVCYSYEYSTEYYYGDPKISECVKHAWCHSYWKQCVCEKGRFALMDGECGLNPDNNFGSYCFNDLDCQPWRKLICRMEIEGADYGKCRCLEGGYEWNGKACGLPLNGNCSFYPYCGPQLTCNDDICEYI